MCEHAGATLCLRFFHFSVQQVQQLKPGVLLGCFGEIRYGYAGLEMVHPDYRIVDSAEQLLEDRLSGLSAYRGLGANHAQKNRQTSA